MVGGGRLGADEFGDGARAPGVAAALHRGQHQEKEHKNAHGQDIQATQGRRRLGQELLELLKAGEDGGHSQNQRRVAGALVDHLPALSDATWNEGPGMNRVRMCACMDV